MDSLSARSNFFVQCFRNFDSKDLGLQDLGMRFRRIDVIYGKWDDNVDDPVENKRNCIMRSKYIACVSDITIPTTNKIDIFV